MKSRTSSGDAILFSRLQHNVQTSSLSQAHSLDDSTTCTSDVFTNVRDWGRCWIQAWRRALTLTSFSLYAV